MNEPAHRYFIVNKPFNMVSQFVSTDNVLLLGSLNFNFPEGIHAIGRLDSNSEGLLILTTNKRVTNLLFQGEVPHKRTYLIQVKGNVSEPQLQKLKTGILTKIKGGIQWTTTPCDVSIVTDPNYEFEPFELQKNYPPYTWLRITLTEGKFHQVRKMVAAIHHRCRRLVRVSIEDICLNDLPPGGVKELEENEFFNLLKIENWQKG
jgi:23S rRNA pseudouridine2457 synthase